MANHSSSKKAIRKIIRRTKINRDRVQSIRTSIKKVEEALKNNDKNAAKEAFKAVEPAIMKGVNKGVIKKNTAARKVSRLSKRVKAIAA